MIGRLLVRRGRLLWWWMLGTVAWRNRRDVVRWFSFLRTAVTDRGARSADELLTEARVRAAVTADASLRQDPDLHDVRVRDGVVTLATTAPDWPRQTDPVRRLEKVKGVAAVHTEWSPAVRHDPPGTAPPLVGVSSTASTTEEVTA